MNLLCPPTHAITQMGQPLDFLLCVLPDKNSSGHLYPAIKRWSHTSGGVPSQCVVCGNMGESDMI